MTDHPTIGASQISAILGIHPWLTQHDVWKDLVHGVKQEDNETLKRGRDWEPDILAKYKRLTGRDLETNAAGVCEHRDYLHATPDAFHEIEADWRLIEAKTSWSSEGWEVLPTHYYHQLQVQLYCWERHGYDTADLAVMFSSFGFKIFPDIKPDRPLQEKLNAAAEKWINDYVIPKKLPPVDHTEACREAIIAQWPSPKSHEYLDADQAAEDLLASLQGHQVILDSAEKVVDQLKNELRVLIGERAGLKGGLFRVDFKQQGIRKSTDWQAILKALEPHLNQKCKRNLAELKERMTLTYPGPRTLRIYWNKEDKGGDDGQAEA